MIKEYAELYSKKEGWFSTKLAENLMNFIKARKLKTFKALDVACGTGEFLSVIRNIVPDCTGFDFEKAMVDVAKKNVPDCNFLVADFLKFSFKEKFNLVSCNYESVNFCLNKSELSQLFSNISKHTEKDGVFAFDFLASTEGKENSVSFEEKPEWDFIRKVDVYDKDYEVRDIFFKPQVSGDYKKITQSDKRRAWTVDEIEEVLIKNGFKDINYVNIDLVPLKNVSKEQHIHVVCFHE